MRVVGGRLLLELTSDSAQVAAGRHALREFLEAAGVSPRALYHAELTFEELVVNVIQHGYGIRSVTFRPIEVSAAVRDKEIVLTFEDTAPPFDPSQAVEEPLPASLDDARIGGFGLRLVRMAAQRIDYQRVGNRNRTTVGIRLT